MVGVFRLSLYVLAAVIYVWRLYLYVLAAVIYVWRLYLYVLAAVTYVWRLSLYVLAAVIYVWRLSLYVLAAVTYVWRLSLYVLAAVIYVWRLFCRRNDRGWMSRSRRLYHRELSVYGRLVRMRFRIHFYWRQVLAGYVVVWCVTSRGLLFFIYRL